MAPQGDWSTWLALSGRGWGKTEAGAQWIRQRVEAGARSIALVAETQKDLEEVMVKRLLTITPPEKAPTVRYKPVRVTWPNGAEALGYNGTEPNQLRGPEFDTAWVDELAKYRYARDTWDMLQFTMRAGDDPRVFVTTTPRPISIIREIASDPSTAVTCGSTFDNSAHLPEQFLENLRKRYEGTSLGRQELYGDILSEAEGALWTRAMCDRAMGNAPDDGLKRIVVAVDPAITANEDSNETGIVIAGRGYDDRGYVLADRTLKGSPETWARRAVNAYHEFEADMIVAESNQGGDMVRSTLKTVDPNAPVQLVRAKRGKRTRAEPISALYEQGRITHVGAFDALVDQLVSWEPNSGDDSPDRLDALVWAFTELMDVAAPFEWYVGN